MLALVTSKSKQRHPERVSLTRRGLALHQGSDSCAYAQEELTARKGSRFLKYVACHQERVLTVDTGWS